MSTAIQSRQVQVIELRSLPQEERDIFLNGDFRDRNVIAIILPGRTNLDDNIAPWRAEVINKVGSYILEYLERTYDTKTRVIFIVPDDRPLINGVRPNEFLNRRHDAIPSL